MPDERRGVAAHLGIRVRDYDRRIRTFIPHYMEMLDEAAAALGATGPRAPVVVDLGVGSGALAALVIRVRPRARIVGIDSDAAMLAMAEQRLGSRLTPIRGDFLSVDLPRCDAFVASFALHHVATARRKRALYARCAQALRPGGLLISADCHLATDPRQQTRDRAAWLAHLRRTYPAARARAYLRAWAREDVYQRLEDEIAMLRSAGFGVDVVWRRDGFAVIVGARRG
jgi:tRNA (cmo5U34)-methyltransferase